MDHGLTKDWISSVNGSEFRPLDSSLERIPHSKQMRIAFLNPYKNVAENQGFKSLEIAASRLGHQVVPCSNSDDLENVRPDFVLALALSQPKLTKFPTYGLIHEPLDCFLATKEYFNSLLSYDGYLTISDTLETFLRNLLYGVGRIEDICYYYDTAQANVADPNFSSRLKQGDVKLTYFGTNWDRRKTKFFKSLSELDGVEIYGPEEAWRGINQKAYKGSLPFDGCSVQEKYKENGMGLVLLSDRHLADDVISNRVFEITSVGAIAICCRIPWLERNFGDNLYYFDQRSTDRRLLEQIRAIIDDVKAHPQDAFDRSQRAQQIFHDKFSMEKLLPNVIRYHEEKNRLTVGPARIARSTRTETPFISVIMRCGGRSPELFVRRAVRSLVQQTLGRFEVLLVRYKGLDVSNVITEFSGALESIRCVDCFGGNRSASLWCGLNEVKGDYFSVLDDDDELLPRHFECLFPSSGNYPKDSYFAYTGSIRVRLKPTETAEGNFERRYIYDFGISDCKSFYDQAGYFSSNCFVASSSLLDQELLSDPQLDTAEDTYLVLSLLARCKARFNFRATAVHYETQGASNWANHPKRSKDVLSVYLRLLSHYPQRPQVVDAYDSLLQLNEAIVAPKIYDLEERDDVTVYHAADFALSRVPKAELRAVPYMLDTAHMALMGNSSLKDARRAAMSIDAPQSPWGYAAHFSLFVPTETSYLVEIDCTVTKGAIGFGVLNNQENGFLYRVAVPAAKKRVLVHLPIEDAPASGRFVIQNWSSGSEARAEISSITLFSESLSSSGAASELWPTTPEIQSTSEIRPTTPEVRPATPEVQPATPEIRPTITSVEESRVGEAALQAAMAAFEELDCMPIMIVGSAGARGPSPGQPPRDAIHARLGTAGTVAYGPYLSLLPGRYEALFEFFAARADRGAAFRVDVATGRGERILAQRRVKPHSDLRHLEHALRLKQGPLTCVLGFDVRGGTQADDSGSIEFRVWSPGTIRFCLVALRVRQIAVFPQTPEDAVAH